MHASYSRQLGAALLSRMMRKKNEKQLRSKMAALSTMVPMTAESMERDVVSLCVCDYACLLVPCANPTPCTLHPCC
jgi:hypothetical protein